MLKLAKYAAAQLALAKQVTALEEMKNDPELKQEIEFEAALETFLTEHAVSRSRLQAFLSMRGEPAAAPALTKSGRKTPVFPARLYKNPHTGEEITVKAHNHGKFKEWVTQYTKAVVESWQQGSPGQPWVAPK